MTETEAFSKYHIATSQTIGIGLNGCALNPFLAFAQDADELLLLLEVATGFELILSQQAAAAAAAGSLRRVLSRRMSPW